MSLPHCSPQLSPTDPFLAVLNARGNHFSVESLLMDSSNADSVGSLIVSTNFLKHYVMRSSRMSRKSVATCYWFQKFPFVSIYVNDNFKADTCRKCLIDDTQI